MRDSLFSRYRSAHRPPPWLAPRPAALRCNPQMTPADLARKQPCHGGFYPFQGLLRLGHYSGRSRPDRRARRSDSSPGSSRAVGNNGWTPCQIHWAPFGYDTQAEGVFRNQPRVFDLAQGSKQCLMILN